MSGRAHVYFGADPGLPITPGVSGLSAAQFQKEYVAANRPVAIKGLCSSWPAVEKWSAGHLADATASLGDIQVAYRSTPENLARMNLALIRQGQTSLLELLLECERDPGGPELYVPGLDLPRDGPLNGDVHEPAILEGLETFGSTVFLGRNTKCIGHYHPKAQALLCQVQGRKRLWLFPPSEFAHLHIFPPLSPSFFQSEINFYGDRQTFRRFSKANGVMFELEPGEGLFIPLHWLHVPEGPGWTVSVTYWWRPGIGEWLRSRGSPRALLGIAGELSRRRFRPMAHT